MLRLHNFETIFLVIYRRSKKLVNTISNVLCMVVPKLKRGKKWQKNEFPNVPDKELVTNNRYVLRNKISFDNF